MEEQLYRQVWIVMDHAPDAFADRQLDRELFASLARQGLGIAFSGFDFASRELPEQAALLVSGSLLDEEFLSARIGDQPRDHSNPTRRRHLNGESRGRARRAFPGSRARRATRHSTSPAR